MDVVQPPARPVVVRLAKGNRFPTLLLCAIAVTVENIDQIVVPPRLVMGQRNQLIELKKVVPQIIQTAPPALSASIHAVEPQVQRVELMG